MSVSSLPHNMKEDEVSIPKMKMDEVYSEIMDNLLASPKISKVPEVGSWIKTVLEYTSNLPSADRSIPSWAMFAYEMLEKPENITEDYRKLSRVLTWCAEMTRSYMTVIDDMLDSAETRGGAPCWHRLPNIGIGAVNDYFLMLSSVCEILEIYFLKTPHYVKLLQIFHESILSVAMGQCLEFLTAKNAQSDYSHYTIERWETIGRYRCSPFLKLPALAGLALVKDVDNRMYADVDDIIFKIGKLYTLQDDYEDCYDTDDETGTFHTDIQERKCTWLAATALQVCNPKQKEIFIKHYGSKKPEDVAIIKSLYNELQIPELYKKMEKEIYEDIMSRIRTLPSESASKFFFKLVDKFRPTRPFFE